MREVPSTHSKYAFARGSSRLHGVPWTAQVSPWHANSVTTRGPMRLAGGTWQGEDAGHSTSFFRRMFLHAWFAGAAMLTPENSVNYFFAAEPNATNTKAAAADPSLLLTAHGRMGQQVNAMMRTHDRGTPHVPLLVVLDKYAGYSRIPCNTAAVAWGTFRSNAAAAETRPLDEAVCPAEILVDLFEKQIWPSAGRNTGGGIDTYEEIQLRPTPFGEIADVVVSGGNLTSSFLAAYSTVLIAGGDVDFAREEGQGGGSTSSHIPGATTTLAAELLAAIQGGGGGGGGGGKLQKVLVQPYHVDRLQQSVPQIWKAMAATGRVEVLQPWTNPATNRATAISNMRLQQLASEQMPVAVAANVSLQWQVNKNSRGSVVLELLNNDGIRKPINASATVDYSRTSAARVTSQAAFKSVWQWGVTVGGTAAAAAANDRLVRGAGAAGATVDVVVPAGGSVFLEFVS